MDLIQVAEAIERVFVEQDKYVFGKYITEFERAGKFGGDVYNFVMIDPLSTPPTFYMVISPFDLVSGKAPEHALLFRDGACIYNQDFTGYTAMRTGLLDALVLKQTQPKRDRLKILLLGSGMTATWSVKGMAVLTPEIKQADYYSKGGQKASFETMGREVGIELNHRQDWREQLGDYDVIICHTNAAEPILTASDISKVKQGVEIHSYITSTEHGELADEFYGPRAQIVSDWPKILEYNKVLQRATKSGGIKPEEITYLRDLFGGKFKRNPGKDYLICQFGGTPIQNLAVLQVLTAKI